MEKRSSVQNRKGKGKKKPIKVVYISNPMRVTSSASEFRALVQELTGQDSDPPLETANFSPADDSHHEHSYIHHQSQPPEDDETDVVAAAAVAAPASKEDCPPPSAPDPAAVEEQERSYGAMFELLEDVLTPKMMEGFNGMNGFFPSHLLYEPQLMDDYQDAV